MDEKKKYNGFTIRIVSTSKFLPKEPGDYSGVDHKEHFFLPCGKETEREITYLFNLWEYIKNNDPHNEYGVIIEAAHITDDMFDTDKQFHYDHLDDDINLKISWFINDMRRHLKI